ncbi:hypothetical protein [Mycobacterium leprae]|uniref:hypothetical protein n=1 Tax=Mycobacterium leprae TaxID=1769 RepID=UPI001E647151|nr:hypothetical protein [Mycobacterium leprae]
MLNLMQSAKCEPVEDKVEQFTEEEASTIGAESDTDAEDWEHRSKAEGVKELVEETWSSSLTSSQTQWHRSMPS